jgi:hypothetical protein
MDEVSVKPIECQKKNNQNGRKLRRNKQNGMKNNDIRCNLLYNRINRKKQKRLSMDKTRLKV